MNLQEYIDKSIKEIRDRNMESSDQLTLGDIISKCQEIKNRDYKQTGGEEPFVRFDFEYLFPTKVDSWRGAYCELALNFETEGAELSLSQFIKLLEDTVDNVFTGYKGGDFKMTKQTPVWVANYGNSGSTAIVGVIDNSYEVILTTGIREY